MDATSIECAASAAAINAADTADTLNISATASGATVTLTMNTAGTSGNQVADIAGSAVSQESNPPVTVSSQFDGGQTGGSTIELRSLALSDHNALKNYGFGIRITSSQEDDTRSYYTKKFFARSSEFFYKRPCIEARWDASSGDDRSKLYARHPNLSNAQNAQSLCLYNSVGGTLQNFTLANPDDGVGNPNDQNVYVRFYRDEDMLNLASFQSYNPADESATAATEISTASPSAPNTNTGVYKANFIMNETGSQIYEKWFIATPNTLSDPTSWVVLRTGSFALKQRTFDGNNTNKDYVLDITNLKNSYTRNEIARFRLYTRLKDWSPTIYSVASKALENEIVEQVYYKIFRVVDEEVIVDYGIGTSGNNREHTKLSYDESGSYFDFDMSFLESGYMYGIKMMFIINGEKKEQPEIFKFRVD